VGASKNFSLDELSIGAVFIYGYGEKVREALTILLKNEWLQMAPNGYKWLLSGLNPAILYEKLL
jgi:hypothetical protein